MDRRYSDDLVERMSLGQGKSIATPGSKEQVRLQDAHDSKDKLNPKWHRCRSGPVHGRASIGPDLRDEGAHA